MPSATAFGQVLAGPVGDVQPLGDRLQASQFDDLGSLQGGKSPGTPQAGGIQRSPSSRPVVAATDTPDGGPVTLQPGGDRRTGSAGGDGQNDAGMLDLEPGQVPAASDGLQDGRSSAAMVRGRGLRPRMGQPPMPEQAPYSSIPVAPNLLHYFVPTPTRLLSDA